MIKSEQELRNRLLPFEYANPEQQPIPLSKVPSEALRQAVADVRHVVAKGACINMAQYGRVNGSCDVCFAGAVLLARGYYGCHVAAAYKDHWSSFRHDDSFSLTSAELWSDPEADNISESFNDARAGDFVRLLCRGGIALPEAVKLNRELGRHFTIDYDGALLDEEVEQLCTTMLAVAEFLAASGH